MLEKVAKSVSLSVVVLGICCVWVLAAAAEPPALAKLSGAEKERVAKLIEGAKKEGELLGYTVSFRPDVQAVLLPAFRKEYGLSKSDLEIGLVSTRSGGIVTKITEELRAKVYKTDIVNNGTVGWFNDLVARGELMAYDCPEYKHFHPLAADPEIAPANPPYFIAGYFSAGAIVYNPKYIKEEILHWKDVLRPEYKGKIACSDVSKSFTHTNRYLALRKVLGTGFFEELGKLDSFVLVSSSGLVNKCISGEFPIIVMGSPSVAWRANKKGAGLKTVFPPEGIPNVGYSITILAHAPHPNAAKLFMDFVHGETGQMVLHQSGNVAGRMGIKAEDPVYPKPIYDLKGSIEMDWRNISSQDRIDAREEFKRLMKIR